MLNYLSSTMAQAMRLWAHLSSCPSTARTCRPPPRLQHGLPNLCAFRVDHTQPSISPTSQKLKQSTRWGLSHPKLTDTITRRPHTYRRPMARHGRSLISAAARQETNPPHHRLRSSLNAHNLGKPARPDPSCPYQPPLISHPHHPPNHMPPLPHTARFRVVASPVLYLPPA